MASSLNPVSSMLRMSLNAGIVNGKTKTVTRSITVRNSLNASDANTVSTSLSTLLNYPLIDVRISSISLLVNS